MSKFIIGQKASVKKVFSMEEVAYYCNKLSLDINKIHTDTDYAIKQGFNKCIVPGNLMVSLFGGLFGSHLPGPNSIHLGQTISFVKYVYVDQEVEAIIEITKLRDDKPIAFFKTIIINSKGEICVEGESVIKYKI